MKLIFLGMGSSLLYHSFPRLLFRAYKPALMNVMQQHSAAFLAAIQFISDMRKIQNERLIFIVLILLDSYSLNVG